MKKILKNLFIKILSNDTVGKWTKQFSTFAWKIKFQRELIERARNEKEVSAFMNQIFKEKTVLNGPLKGLKYPGFRSKNSSLYSKLIGSYEKELHGVFDEIIATLYEQILDVGCAEGYYAVGLALKMPQVTVYAYDIDAEARELTSKMAELNGVAERVKVSNNCDTQTLKNFPFKNRSLIICDSEGYEKQLFTKECLANLSKTDLLIETHDFMDITISTGLEELFSKSHDLKIIQSVGDVIKAKTYQYPELKGMDIKTKYRIFEEGRNFTDEWLYLKARK
jgi:precorrin-6B methylase 2